jgi:serine kinase of HPr protein (carbohydrate metabolism regulator)
MDTHNDNCLSVVDKVNKNNTDNKINVVNLSTFHYYLEQHYIYLSSALLLKTFSTKEITFIMKLLKTKNSHVYNERNTKLIKISATYIYSSLTYFI